MTPDRIRDCRDSLWVVIQSPLVSGTSRSEQPSDKHALYERIGIEKTTLLTNNLTETIFNPCDNGSIRVTPCQS